MNMNERMKNQIYEEKKKLGQPVELSDEDKLIMKIADKVVNLLNKNLCRRCTHMLVTEDEIKNGYCSNCWELVVEQRNHERAERKEILNNRIKNAAREISFKNDELNNEDIKETFVIIKGDDGKPVAYEGFKDSLKPEFMIYNEIENLKYQIEMYKKQLDGINKAEEQDGKTSSDEDGDKGTA